MAATASRQLRPTQRVALPKLRRSKGEGREIVKQGQSRADAYICETPLHPHGRDWDGIESPSRYKPGARLVRKAGLRPRLQGGSESLVHGLFGEIEIAEQAHQRSQNSARLRSVKSLYGPTQIFGRIRRHDVKLANGQARHNCSWLFLDPSPSKRLMADYGQL